MVDRLAYLVTRYPIPVIVLWILLVALSIPFARLAPQNLVVNASDVKNSKALEVNRIYRTAFGQTVIDRTLLVSESSIPATDPKFLAVYRPLLEQITSIKGITGVRPFNEPGPLLQVNPSATVTATILDTSLEGAEAIVDKIRQKARSAQTSEIKFYVSGASAITKDFLYLLEADVKRSELLALPVTGMVLLLAFGAMVAAGLPLIVGVISISLGMAVLYVLTLFTNVTSFAQSAITMLALGAGIDYALILVGRFREEMAAGLSPREAAHITVQTAGRSVGFSGLVVAIAMGALLVPELTTTRSMGLGGMMAVMFTVLASITLLPALLTLLGDRVNSPRRLAFTLQLDTRPFWGRWADSIMKSPGVYLLVAGGLLVVLAWPIRDLKIGYAGAFALGPGVESRKGLELIRSFELGGAIDAFEVILDLGSQGFSAQSRSQWRVLEQKLSAWDQVRVVISPFLARSAQGQAGDIISLTNQYISQDRRYLRLTVIPKDALKPSDIYGWDQRIKLEAAAAGFNKVVVGGAPIGSMEFTQALLNATPIAIGAVFFATFGLMAVAFRSILIPLKSIALNSLTVVAAYGVVTLIFVKGVGASWLGVTPDATGTIEGTLPLTMFAIIFGLSMDYEVFLLSRIQEGHLAGLDIRSAVKSALERTAGAITSAAAVMLIVFSAFIFGQVLTNKIAGVGLVVAVILDVTLVRLVLVPAVMVIAGRWNWWLPAWLDRMLPHQNPSKGRVKTQ
jgi:putative drug exporter of the RND superfamily